MPSSWSTGGATRRARILWNWLYFTLLAAGFATIVAAVLLANEFWIGIGVTAFSLGGLLLAVSLFFAHATLRAPVAAPTPAAAQAAPVMPEFRHYRSSPKASSGGEIQFDYDAASPGSKGASSNVYPPLRGAQAAAPAGQEELIEFELVEERQAPTRLGVPPAFQLEQTVDALAEGPVAITPAAVREDFVPAVARRKEIVSGLPILSRVFADEPPAATQVQTRPDGKTRGQCGNCGTFLWAPSERPIRLRCPRCGNVKTLTA